MDDQPPIVLRSAEADGHNYGTVWLACANPTCAAEWVGYPEDECAYCAIREIRVASDKRKDLLFPPWAMNGNGPRYDSLDETTKAVWRTTRGQKEDTDSLVKWAHELAAAVQDGTITEMEAEAAIARVSNANG